MKPLAHDEFYMEAGKFVLTERFHLRRGTCCGNGCRHCPFAHQAVPEAVRAKKEPPRPFYGECFSLPESKSSPL